MILTTFYWNVEHLSRPAVRRASFSFFFHSERRYSTYRKLGWTDAFRCVTKDKRNSSKKPLERQGFGKEQTSRVEKVFICASNVARWYARVMHIIVMWIYYHDMPPAFSNISTARNNPAIDKSIHMKMCGKCRVTKQAQDWWGKKSRESNHRRKYLYLCIIYIFMYIYRYVYMHMYTLYTR